MKRIGVVIPARNEEDLIERCVRSVARAAGLVDVEVSIIVVADGCSDATARLAAACGATVVEIDASNVGAARAVGAEAAIACGADWLANTDADSVVPSDWLISQLELAADGADTTVGMVRPDFAELTREQQDVWWRTHSRGEALGHVHGANLGIRVASYLEVGGYRPLPEHEDNDLVHRLARSHAVLATTRGEVVTSGRLVGRTPGGYARYLREMLDSEHIRDADEPEVAA
ncbi:MAG: glycosyltransferase [Pseudolysinimonas sp.]